MKQHLYEPALFLRDGKEWIKAFTMERPMQQLNEYNLPFAKKMKKFLASAVEYPVCEGFNGTDQIGEHAIRVVMKELNLNELWGSHSIFLKRKAEGIRIDDLADRLEVVSGLQYCLSDECALAKKCTSNNPYGKGCGSGSEYFIRIRPEVKEESQDELWKEVFARFIVAGKYQDSNDFLGILKQQFTIKRNK